MARDSKRTARRDKRFFDAIKKGHGITKAAELANYSRRVVYNYREKDQEFKDRWQEARDSYIEELEAEADRRAKDGVEDPVFFRGVECGRVRKYSDNLLMFRLKALAPKVYREYKQDDEYKAPTIIINRPSEH